MQDSQKGRPGQRPQQGHWQIWVDTGGTFTDCLALTPNGNLRRIKVLSNSALRGTVTSIDGLTVGFSSSWNLVPGFADGAQFRALGLDSGRSENKRFNNKPSENTPSDKTPSDKKIRVVKSDGHNLELQHRPRGIRPGAAFELLFDEQAPVLAARLITGASSIGSLPPLQMRLATTRGTNALLERRGAKTAFLVTRGFGDLLRIGDQHRPDLFARRVRRPEPLYEKSVEVSERLDAQGNVIEAIDLDQLRADVSELRRSGFEAIAIALMHSYLNPEHERLATRILREAGFAFVSASAELTPTLKLLPRAQTAVVDAYLSPVVGDYLDQVIEAVGKDRLQVMTSAGGLAGAADYRAKDSLLSGPAGGVVGAVRRGKEPGFDRLIAFDMGGTSTDVSRYDGEYHYRFAHQVGDVTLAAPALAIETVAAGGGSICRIEEGVLKVGPESAGASPGPACYGAGGPLTVTDVNLLLGRLDAERFEIPIHAASPARNAQAQLESLAAETSFGVEHLLLGYLAIANQRMADAVRQISVRQGYDPSEYAMVAFGGAGGLHGCEVAEQLGMSVVLWPREAGLLSALGLGAAVIERFAERQILESLDEVGGRLETWLEDLADQALRNSAGSLEGGRSWSSGAEEKLQVRRRLAFMRLVGQESTLELEVQGSVEELRSAFLKAYQERFGYRPADRTIELESLRVVVSASPLLAEGCSLFDAERHTQHNDRVVPRPFAVRSACFDGAWIDTPVFELESLVPGALLDGPALVFDRHASFVVPAGWAVTCAEDTLVARAGLAPTRKLMPDSPQSFRSDRR